MIIFRKWFNLAVLLPIIYQVYNMETAHVCLKVSFVQNELSVECRVDQLTSTITIEGPNGYLGTCHPPIHGQNSTDCSDNIIQNLKTNITFLKLKNVENITAVNGLWTCRHGTNTGSDTFNLSTPSEAEHTSNGEDQTCGGHSGRVCCPLFGIVLVLFLVIVPFSCCLYPTFSTLFDKYFRRPSDRKEHAHLLPKINQDEGGGLRCKTCGVLSVCAICTDCELFYCVVCAEHHIKNKPNHGVCELNHLESNRITGKCKSCRKKPLKRVCIKCNTLLCDKCNCNHSEQKDNVRQLRTDLNRSRSTSECKMLVDSTSLIYTLCYTDSNRFPKDRLPVRICGLAFLGHRRIVLADSNNRKIMVFKEKDCIVKYALDEEPRGVTRIYDNKFAVSFATSQRIVSYEISGESIIENKVYPMSTIGKPFSISYHQDHYAVEIGEGEDGFIVILDHEGKEIYKIPNDNNFAFYTGNTIRICLNMIDSCVYVAAMSKKSVSCVKFDGTILWNSQFPSPRGIVLIPGRQLANKNVLLASKRGSIIYQINTSDGTADILLNEKDISGPRYIAFEPTENLLCVQIDGGAINVYKYDTGEI